jgi:hypothetical protein
MDRFCAAHRTGNFLPGTGNVIDQMAMAHLSSLRIHSFAARKHETDATTEFKVSPDFVLISAKAVALTNLPILPQS